ncbi:serine hydrolase [Actinoplanes sp. NBRC 14428]|nr:serine hydrolase [Actinoplanes sp. NBRC 14428]
MALIAGVTVAGTALAGVGVSQASVEHRPAPVQYRPPLEATLQADADAMLKYGMPGVLAEVDTPRGNVTVRSGYGDLAKRTPVPWNAKFRIGSFTKSYVAATLLQLVGERKVSLEDKVDRYLPGVVEGNGNDGRKITVRQLLQHTSGLPEYTDGMDTYTSLPNFQKGRYDSWTDKELVALAMKFPPKFKPGAEWSYSNTNYTLAGMIIEKVTRHTWQHEVRKRIVAPLGLRDTSLPGTKLTVPKPHAVGYTRFPGPNATEENPDWSEQVDATILNPSYGGAAGEMISTTDDGNKFLKALMRGKVLRPAQLREMLRTVPTPEIYHSQLPGLRYGLGIMWVDNSCGGSWGHGGSIEGYWTRNGVTRDGSRAVTVSLNTDKSVPAAGVQPLKHDIALDLIDHALCGVR